MPGGGGFMSVAEEVETMPREEIVHVFIEGDELYRGRVLAACQPGASGKSAVSVRFEVDNRFESREGLEAFARELREFAARLEYDALAYFDGVVGS
jgi:hypothetical protein